MQTNLRAPDLYAKARLFAYRERSADGSRMSVVLLSLTDPIVVQLPACQANHHQIRLEPGSNDFSAHSASNCGDVALSAVLYTTVPGGESS